MPDFPLTIKPEHVDADDFVMLKLEEQLKGGHQLGPEAEARVRRWRAELDGAGETVAYHPERGFSRIRRQPGQGDIVPLPD